MPIMIPGISLPFTQPPELALEAAKKLLGGAEGVYTVSRRALDARRRQDIRFVYSVTAEVPGEGALAERLGGTQARLYEPPVLKITPTGEMLSHPPVVTGFGPAGMFAALLLARHGYCPVVLERGADVDTRVARVSDFWHGKALDEETNVQFGEGGAGTFSDGKLMTRISDARCRFVLEELVSHGAPEEILFQAKPHVGTDRLREVVKAVRQEIVSLGGEIRFLTRLDEIRLRGGSLASLGTSRGELAAEVLVLAPGHSARDTFRMLHGLGARMSAKAFSVGLRIEHPQSEIDRALYGENAGHPLLPPGEYQLSLRRGESAVYTFCMCPGGLVIPAASSEGMLVTNGMSELARNHVNANAALVASVSPREYGAGVFAGMEFQQKLERAAFEAGGQDFKAPMQTLGAFRGNKARSGRVRPSYAIGVKEAAFTQILPEFVVEMLEEGIAAFGRKLRGFDAPDAVLTGVETRTSSPVRIERGEDMQALDIGGLYPCGEGAGYAGGIMSAAVDGISAAEALIRSRRPPKG